MGEERKVRGCITLDEFSVKSCVAYCAGGGGEVTAESSNPRTDDHRYGRVKI